MIRRLESKQEQRSVRLKLYSDDVYVIAHKAVKEVTATLSVEEIFSSADNLASHLLENGISDKDFIDMEIDDVREELDDERDLFPLLSVTFVKLCALRKVKPIAADIARALVHRCQEFEDFTPLLGKLAKEENKRILDKGRINLMEYELKTLEEEGFNEDSVAMLDELVSVALKMDIEDQKVVERLFSRYNDNNNHTLQQYVDKIRQHTDQCTQNQNMPSTINTGGGPAILGGNFSNDRFYAQNQLESK